MLPNAKVPLAVKNSANASAFSASIAEMIDSTAFDKVWERLIPVEKQGDSAKKAFAVLIKVDRAEESYEIHK